MKSAEQRSSSLPFPGGVNPEGCKGTDPVGGFGKVQKKTHEGSTYNPKRPKEHCETKGRALDLGKKRVHRELRDACFLGRKDGTVKMKKKKRKKLPEGESKKEAGSYRLLISEVQPCPDNR